MAVFTYTAINRGALISGHTEGTEYSIEIPLAEWLPDLKKNEEVTKSLSGIKYTVLHHIESKFRFKTVSTDDQSILDQFEELFGSVLAGELFTIDPFGTLSTPGTEVTISMDGKHNYSRVGQIELSFSGKVDVE